ncbi:hypothetical protein CEUSTIGMA_g10548.t1 [Chlamydomonas eustigma]|uniref:Uncharacterized protein n=1 Tax=Chlamydomonas eustigma TaxID=1157962 RepID=A0A250XJN1_9CHLO|nr:hypothetical protein CEUSTIGMA_g10548.t1 [Chlamydomonas eustigma]|eukprot:GAX83122.1 hypothetical protein CEUSTIGMA_g10548.t1 [Chlamydomonas eustigma]
MHNFLSCFRAKEIEKDCGEVLTNKLTQTDSKDLELEVSDLTEKLLTVQAEKDELTNKSKMSLERVIELEQQISKLSLQVTLILEQQALAERRIEDHVNQELILSAQLQSLSEQNDQTRLTLSQTHRELEMLRDESHEKNEHIKALQDQQQSNEQETSSLQQRNVSLEEECKALMGEVLVKEDEAGNWQKKAVLLETDNTSWQARSQKAHAECLAWRDQAQMMTQEAAELKTQLESQRRQQEHLKNKYMKMQEAFKLLEHVVTGVSDVAPASTPPHTSKTPPPQAVISKTSPASLHKLKSAVGRPSPLTSAVKDTQSATARQIIAVRQSTNFLRKSFAELGHALELGSEQRCDDGSEPDVFVDGKLSKDSANSQNQRSGHPAMPLFPSPCNSSVNHVHDETYQTTGVVPVNLASIPMSVNEERSRRCTEEAVHAALKGETHAQHSDIKMGSSDQSRQKDEMGPTASAVAGVLYS